LELAQLQAPQTEEEKKHKAPPVPPKAAPPQPPPKAAPPPPPPPRVAPPQPPPKAAPPPPPPPKAAPPSPLPPSGAPPAPKGPPAEKKVIPPTKEPPPPEKKSLSPAPPPGPPPAAKSVPPDLPKGVGPVPQGKKDSPKSVAPAQPVAPEKGGPAAMPKVPPGTPPSPPAASGVQPVAPEKGGPAAMPKVPPGTPLSPPAAGAHPPIPPAAAFQQGPQAAVPAPRFDQVQKGRQERVEEGGRRTVIQEPGNRVIVKQDNRVFIKHDDAERFRRLRDARTEKRPDGMVETFYVRPDGVRVVSVVDPSGRLMRRYRRGHDGREYDIIDNRRFYRTAIGVGVGAFVLGVIALNLPPPVVSIPREQYIVEYERATDDDLYEALSAPPVDRLERAYSLDEIRYSYELRDRMRRVDLDTINFEFGAFEVTPDQYPKLERVARAILRVLSRDPDEVFLIEGHTDAVGSDVDNLSLSDRRAEAVAQTLTETFGVPPENLVTQGYGKQYLKIDTPGPERANRRVAVRRITPLMSERR
jgi:outer membrane protein OmpA-like peptidoglycan-associated protein